MRRRAFQVGWHRLAHSNTALLEYLTSAINLLATGRARAPVTSTSQMLVFGRVLAFRCEPWFFWKLLMSLFR